MLNDVQPHVDKTRGKMLISMPHLADPRFYHSTLAMYKHDDEGAGGVIFNKPARTIILSDLFGNIGISLLPDMHETPVYYGGPVNTNQVFVLHSHDYLDRDTAPICAGVSMTTNRHILTAIANKTGPSKYKICLGHAVWGPKQLESELSGTWQHNELSSWLYNELKPEDIFSTVNIWPVSVERYSKGIAGNILNYMEKKHAPTSKS
jgi:putative transcriptional regulator